MTRHAADAAQLGLQLDEQPKRWRESVLVSFHTRKQPMPASEALEGEKRAGRQERLVLAWFRQRPSARFTPREVHTAMGGDETMLLNSTRRSLTNLSNPRRWALGPPPLEHHERDRREGPYAKESTWSLRG